MSLIRMTMRRPMLPEPPATSINATHTIPASLKTTTPVTTLMTTTRFAARCAASGKGEGRTASVSGKRRPLVKSDAKFVWSGRRKVADEDKVSADVESVGVGAAVAVAVVEAVGGPRLVDGSRTSLVDGSRINRSLATAWPPAPEPASRSSSCESGWMNRWRSRGQILSKVHEIDFTSGAPRLPSSGIAQLSPSTACIPASSRPSSMSSCWWIPILLALGADEL